MTYKAILKFYMFNFTIRYALNPGLAFVLLLGSIAVKTAAIDYSQYIGYKTMKPFIVKERPSCKDSETRGSKSSILKPVDTIAI